MTESHIWKNPTNKPLVVVIGAGFGGLNFVKSLHKKDCEILLVDKNNYHQFQPLLYQVAISGLEPDSIVSPIRKLFDQCSNVHFLMGEFIKVNAQEKYIALNVGTVAYDHLVFAVGSETNFYGNKNLEKNCFGLKSINDAINIRSWIIQNLEAATLFPKEKKYLNFVIAGSGPAGVEMAGALAEFKARLLTKDYPELVEADFKIYLLEGSTAALSAMSVKSQKQAQFIIEKMGINLIPNALVKNFENDLVTYQKNNEAFTITTNTLIWTAGVIIKPILGMPKESLGPSNRLKVNAHLQVDNVKSIYAIGDAAFLTSAEFVRGLPMVAQTAIQQGRYLAKNIFNTAKTPFTYKNKGAMAIIGMNNAVADINSVFLKGRLGWMLWSLIHIFTISSFKNRLNVAFNWFMKYIKYENSNQLIIRKITK